MQMTKAGPSALFVRELYTQMLLTRLVDDAICMLYEQGYTNFVASCRGHEAAQVGSAVCIEVGRDFTLPYYRDLGVVLTVGMTPREVFYTYLQAHSKSHQELPQDGQKQQTLHWGYQKHNMITGDAPVATQILHAAGIAFASRLRKAPIVTVAYCGDGATAEPDFLEGLRFAAQHQLPVIFICEQDCTHALSDTLTTCSCIQQLSLPKGLTHRRIDGTDIVTVYTTMQAAMQQAREYHEPVLLEMDVTRPGIDGQLACDPLQHCQSLLQEQQAWDEVWAQQLFQHLTAEVEQALQDALRDNR